MSRLRDLALAVARAYPKAYVVTDDQADEHIEVPFNDHFVFEVGEFGAVSLKVRSGNDAALVMCYDDLTHKTLQSLKAIVDSTKAPPLPTPAAEAIVAVQRFAGEDEPYFSVCDTDEEIASKALNLFQEQWIEALNCWTRLEILSMAIVAAPSAINLRDPHYWFLIRVGLTEVMDGIKVASILQKLWDEGIFGDFHVVDILGVPEDREAGGDQLDN
jgi:hypothetical protein